jgi:hypothetical protein
VQPAAQRLADRRATPATLTGVSGRPTTASALETKLKEPEVTSLSGASNPTKAAIPASSTIVSFLDIIIVRLLSKQQDAKDRSAQMASNCQMLHSTINNRLAVEYIDADQRGSRPADVDDGADEP